MDTLIYILVTLAILVAVAYWFRGYWPGIRTHYARARGFWQLFQGLRGRSGGQRRGGQSREGQSGRFPGQSRVIDVEPTSVGPSSKASQIAGQATGQKEKCRVCGDALSSAQLSALRQNDIRCTGSSRVAKACPYRNYN